MRLSIVLLALVIACTGCSNNDIYNVSRGWLRDECTHIVEDAERAKCLETVNKRQDEQERKKVERKE